LKNKILQHNIPYSNKEYKQIANREFFMVCIKKTMFIFFKTQLFVNETISINQLSKSFFLFLPQKYFK